MFKMNNNSKNVCEHSLEVLKSQSEMGVRPAYVEYIYFHQLGVL